MSHVGKRRGIAWMSPHTDEGRTMCQTSQYSYCESKAQVDLGPDKDASNEHRFCVTVFFEDSEMK